MEVRDRVVEQLLLCDPLRVFRHVLEEERDLRAVLHGRDEQVAQLQSLAPLVRFTPLKQSLHIHVQRHICNYHTFMFVHAAYLIFDAQSSHFVQQETNNVNVTLSSILIKYYLLNVEIVLDRN